MNLNALHRRLMQDILEVGNNLPLVITGGYAVQAHQEAGAVLRRRAGREVLYWRTSLGHELAASDR